MGAAELTVSQEPGSVIPHESRFNLNFCIEDKEVLCNQNSSALPLSDGMNCQGHRKKVRK